MDLFGRLWKSVERRVLPERHLANEEKVRKEVAEQVIGICDEGWKPFVIVHEGEQSLRRLVASPFLLGYLYAWCDIMTINFGGDRGGHACINSFLDAINHLYPEEIAEQMFFCAEQYLNDENAQFMAGASIGHQDYNRFAGNGDGDRSPIGLLSLAKFVSSSNT